MFAMFNLGVQELIILAVLGFLLFGGLVLVVLTVVFVNRRKERD
jgi:hypothetical protein